MTENLDDHESLEVKYISCSKDSNVSIVTYYICRLFFDLDYFVCLLDNKNKIITNFNLPETRNSLGSIFHKEYNVYIFVHFTYYKDEDGCIINY